MHGIRWCAIRWGRSGYSPPSGGSVGEGVADSDGASVVVSTGGTTTGGSELAVGSGPGSVVAVGSGADLVGWLVGVPVALGVREGLPERVGTV
jgi:hypothetical protein